MIEKGRYQATPEFNILTVEGAKTISFEIIDQLNSSETFEQIDFIVVPMGSGSLLYSIWKGFKQAKEFKLVDAKFKLPKIIGVQADGFDPITRSFDSGNELQKSEKGTNKKSVAGAIHVRNPTFGEKAIQSINESFGIAISVSEKEIISASKLLGKKEGIFAELSSATVIAAIEKLQNENYFSKDAQILALITSSGLKTSSSFQQSQTRVKKVESFRSMGTKVEILRIINSSEANFGYGIWKALGQTISLQAIYQHLKELLKQDFLKEMASTKRQKKYSLTEKGVKLIKKMLELEQLLS